MLLFFLLKMYTSNFDCDIQSTDQTILKIKVEQLSISTKSKHYSVIVLEAEEVPHKMLLKKLFGCGRKVNFSVRKEEIRRGKTVVEEEERVRQGCEIILVTQRTTRRGKQQR